MRVLVLSLVLVLFSACAKEEAAPAAAAPAEQQTEDSGGGDLALSSVAVAPKAVGKGQPATLTLELNGADPSQALTVDWFAPDGWLASHETVNATEKRLTRPVPTTEFEKGGQYAVYVMSGKTLLGQESITVAE